MSSTDPTSTSYTTKELSAETWPDFVKLFTQGNGWDHCWCMHFHRPRGLPKSQHLRTRAERSTRNRPEKQALIVAGRSHGILVYADDEPVGWCQYGRADELPRIDNSRHYRALRLKPACKLWRISCFAVLKTHRRRGVASAGLQAALESIKAQGGGMVEAYPISRWRQGTFGNESTHGTLSVFKRNGFKIAAPLGSTRFSTHVLVRKTV